MSQKSEICLNTEELLAILHHMHHHNEAHEEELKKCAEMAKQLGRIKWYESLQESIHHFHAGNEMLEEVLHGKDEDFICVWQK